MCRDARLLTAVACQNGQCTVPSYNPAQYNGCCPQGARAAAWSATRTIWRLWQAAPAAIAVARLLRGISCPVQTNWHGAYYDIAWGTPVALVVPAECRPADEVGLGRHQYASRTDQSPVWTQLCRPLRRWRSWLPADADLAKFHRPVRHLLRSRSLVDLTAARTPARRSHREEKQGDSTKHPRSSRPVCFYDSRCGECRNAFRYTSPARLRSPA